jgi:hypothetical protein
VTFRGHGTAQPADTTPPYALDVAIPVGTTALVVEAMATDNFGSAGFAAPTTLATGDGLPRLVAPGDLEGDGNQDIVTVNAFPEQDFVAGVVVLHRDGNGAFIPTANSPTFIGPLPEGLLLQDVNGDDRIDVLTASANGGGVVVLLNQAPR